MTDCSGKGFRYDYGELIQWPFHLVEADTHNPQHIVPLPNPHGVIGSRKIAFIGDVMPTRDGLPVTIDAPVRALLAGCEALVCNLEAPALEDAVYEGPVKGLKLAFSRDGATKILDQLGDPKHVYVSLGNNHANDYGEKQFRHTVHFLRDRGHPIVGCSDAMLGINELFLGDIKVGLMGWTHWLNAEWLGKCREFRPTLRGDVFEVDFHRVKLERKLDCLVAFTHWGFEFKHFPHAPFDAFAKQLADQGIDVNVGGHPHVVSPLARAGSGYVHYSLGDFSGLHVPWHTRLGSILRLSLGRCPGGVDLGFERTPIYRREQPGGDVVTTLENLSSDLRSKCEERFGLVTPR